MSEYQELQKKAGQYGIKGVGVKADDLKRMIAEAEAGGAIIQQPPAEPGANAADEPKAETPKPAKAAPPQPAVPAIDPATAALYAVLTKEIQDKFAEVQNMHVNKKGKLETPEAAIVKAHKTDSATIAHQKKVPITIPGGYVGAPKRVTVCVNGCMRIIPVGVEVMVPESVAEVLNRSRKMEQKNIERSQKLQKKARDAGI